MIDRRHFLRTTASWGTASFLATPFAMALDDLPQSVKELWADFDPRRDPLETETLREWKEDGAVLRHVRFLIGTFKKRPSRLTAVYGFPERRQERLPAVMHIHGGGQRGSVSEVKLLVARGYAGLSVNWGGSGDGKSPFNACEKAEPGDPNTDWGAVDPSQLNAQGYTTMLPGPGQFYEDREHPKNNNWYLLTIACRRGLTFLEKQPETDPDRLGVHGYSMGGNLTMYVIGTDDRVKAAVPGVGGQGWRWQPHEFIGGSATPEHIRGNLDLFRRTLSFESYAPSTRCPVLHRSSTNDFHGWMDDVYRTNALIPNQALRYSWSPHFNHRLTPEVAVSMPLWFDHYLKGGPALPETPATQLRLAPVPVMRVRPAPHPWPVARCDIYYSVDPDPRARFWRRAEVTRDGDAFSAELPLHSLKAPLFAFANVYHTLPKPESLAQIPGNGAPVRELCLSSLLHHHTAEQLDNAGVTSTIKSGLMIDDFAGGLVDWYVLNAGNPTHQQLWTRKLTDPLWRGANDSKLQLTLTVRESNRLSFVMIQNEWRSYRGPRKTFVATREIQGSEKPQTLTFGLNDFTSVDGSLASWKEIDQFGICARYAHSSLPTPTGNWNGPGPEYRRLEWT